MNILKFKTKMLTKPEDYDCWFNLRESKNKTLVIPYIETGLVELSRADPMHPAIAGSRKREWLMILHQSKKMTAIPDDFSPGAQQSLNCLIKRGWNMTDIERHNAQKKDWSNYSEAFAEERNEGLIEGTKNLARKMLALGEPLEKVLSLTGFSKQELMGGH